PAENRLQGREERIAKSDGDEFIDPRLQRSRLFPSSLLREQPQSREQFGDNVVETADAAVCAEQQSRRQHFVAPVEDRRAPLFQPKHRVEIIVGEFKSNDVLNRRQLQNLIRRSDGGRHFGEEVNEQRYVRSCGEFFVVAFDLGE